MRYQVKVFMNDKTQRFVGAIGKASRDKSKVNELAAEVNVVLSVVGANACAFAAEVSE